MDEKRLMLRHFLTSIAYRTQKALRDAPDNFGTFQAADSVRSPKELVRHMNSVLGYARTFLVGGAYRAEPLPSLREEVARLHSMLEDLGRHLELGTPFLQGVSAERLLQGPFSDAMTHAGQLAFLRRLAGSPVPPENFLFAEVHAERLGAEQAQPAKPDRVWREAPPGWVPPAS
jgi:hypothetical protein